MSSRGHYACESLSCVTGMTLFLQDEQSQSQSPMNLVAMNIKATEDHCSNLFEACTCSSCWLRDSCKAGEAAVADALQDSGTWTCSVSGVEALVSNPGILILFNFLIN